MAKYDLTKALETSFTFTISEKEFSFRKPTVREMRAIAKTFAAVEREKDLEKQVELSDAAMAEIYSFVEPVGHDIKIEDALADQSVDVQKAFNKMIKDELTGN